MLEKIADYYTSQWGKDGVYAYAGALSVFITKEQLQHIITLKGIK